jgi:cation diffusion facilitator CzcD-associated flavoprotein CzcO
MQLRCPRASVLVFLCALPQPAHTLPPGQRRILDYLRQVATEHGLTAHLRLGTAISEATYLDDRDRWRLTTESGQQIVTEVVAFAVGQLHRPNIPDFPGRTQFTGPVFHTACWDHDTDLSVRDVAVIGTGSSAAQILPAVAEAARYVRVYQRTPQWVLPKPATDFGALTRTALRLPGAHTASTATRPDPGGVLTCS